MKVYHGNTVIVEKPNIEVLNYKTSFGKGFHTFIDRDTAEYWAEVKRQKILRKDKNLTLKKYINVYEFNENENLNILDFDKVDELDKIDYRFFGREKMRNDLLHNYDIVKGAKINEKLVQFLKEYKQRKLQREELLNMLIIYKTINEVSFYTEKATKSLKFLYAEEIKQSDKISLYKL